MLGLFVMHLPFVKAAFSLDKKMTINYGYHMPYSCTAVFNAVIEDEIISDANDAKVVLFHILQHSFHFSPIGSIVKDRCFKTKRKQQLKCALICEMYRLG